MYSCNFDFCASVNLAPFFSPQQTEILSHLDLNKIKQSPPTLPKVRANAPRTGRWYPGSQICGPLESLSRILSEITPLIPIHETMGVKRFHPGVASPLRHAHSQTQWRDKCQEKETSMRKEEGEMTARMPTSQKSRDRAVPRRIAEGGSATSSVVSGNFGNFGCSTR
jgi:hypothetical protein